MKDERDSDEVALERLFSGLADSLDGVSDRDLLQEVREMGEDPEAMAREVHLVLAAAVKRFRQTSLEKARLDHRLAVQAFEGRAHRLPTDMPLKRALLARVLASRPDMGGLTAQWRDGDPSAIPDADVDDLLNQLEALGLLGDE